MDLHWGWLIVIYLFLGGLGAGAYLTSFAAGNGWLGKSPALERVGYYVAAPIVAFGTLLLVFDLGQGLKKPWLLIGLLSNPRSVMTWGVYILATFILVGLVVAYFTLKKRTVPKILLNIGAILALATCAYTGLLVAVVKAIPFWNTFLMPVLFVVSALSTGLSLTSVLGHFMEKGLHTNERKVTQIHLALVAAEMVVLAILFGMMVSGTNGPIAAASANQVVFGSLAIPFWVVLVAAGLVIPFFVFLFGLRKLAPSGAGALQPELVPAASEVASASHQGGSVTNAFILSDAGVILGGFVLRYVVIFAALPIWNGVIN